ncbi:unnamed protein product [Fusarium venenatum]|uniref:Uncharacterized protein n=1 Tax=Fusarium venenatum TaxID=56646 RepID=A0A2L2TAL8_9HYPO|nr:unnamed protein product [Fusarium venenatum]
MYRSLNEDITLNLGSPY